MEYLYIIWLYIIQYTDRQPEPKNMSYHHHQQKTTTFDLTVAYTDNKLTISLKDYFDSAVYYREYTDEDVGKEVHRKMDLIDLYSAFCYEKL